jgi:hypothetical protein
MDDEKIEQYFNNPNDNANVDIIYVRTMCKQAIHGFIDEHMNNSNFKIFGAILNNKGAIMRFKCNDWQTNDEWVYQSVNIEFRKLGAMSNTNVRDIAALCRMIFFIDFITYNRNSGDRHVIFKSIFYENENNIKKMKCI